MTRWLLICFVVIFFNYWFPTYFECRRDRASVNKRPFYYNILSPSNNKVLYPKMFTHSLGMIVILTNLVVACIVLHLSYAKKNPHFTYGLTVSSLILSFCSTYLHNMWQGETPWLKMIVEWNEDRIDVYYEKLMIDTDVPPRGKNSFYMTLRSSEADTWENIVVVNLQI